MAKTRLRSDHRDVLRRLTLERVDTPAAFFEVKESAYQRAAGLIKEWVRRSFPQTDMAVLAKYKHAAPDLCLKFTHQGGRVAGWRFRDDEPDMPLMPCSAHTYSHPVHEAGSPEIVNAIEAFEKARDRAKDALAKARQPYMDLIRDARTFEEVAEIWPEAAAVRDEICGSKALMVISEELAAAIKKDMDRRGALKIAA